ncbi:MAG: T9SS type A sorting domain-containing protein [Ignavibacteria bacterium]|nr:T9SS type A sorting domain-containing protein [Ignavibacteria bacterium]
MRHLLKIVAAAVLIFPAIPGFEMQAQAPVWSSAANIPVPVRAGNTASYSKSGNGYLFIVSGRDQNEAIVKTVQRYSISANSWDTLNPHPTGLLGGATAVLKDTLYVIGGVVNPPGSGSSIVYKYNIQGNSWSQAANFPFATGDGKAVSYQDSLIYVAGGFAGPNSGIVYLYNAVSNTWRPADFFPSATRRTFGGFAVTGDTLIYMCGTSSFGSSIYFDSVYVGVISQSDRARIKWTRGANFPGQSRTFFDAHSWGASGIIMTGGSTDNTFNTYSNECYTFSPGRNSWTRLPDKPTSWLTGQSGSVQLPNSVRKLICASGYNTGYLNNTELLTDTIGSVGINLINSEQPGGYLLQQNYPNPFNPYTSITYRIASPGAVTLKVYDPAGKEVAVLVNEFQRPGTYRADFDARTLNSGVYFYRLLAGDFEDARKMVVVK